MKIIKIRSHLNALVESSLLIAVGFALSFFTIVRLPQEGAVTPLSMLPILLIGLRHGPKWGLGSGFAYASLQLVQSLPSALQYLPAPSALTIGSVVMLDYIAAFTVLGLSGFFIGKRYGLVYAAPPCMALRFLCHFTSGIVIWDKFAGDVPVWLYSLVYNGSYMGIELIATTAAAYILCRTAPFLLRDCRQ